MSIARSWLVVPGGDASALAEALASPADVVVADLTAAPLDERADARAVVDAWLAAPAGDGEAAVERWVWAGDGDAFEDDVQVIMRHRPAGVMVPHAANAALLVELDHILGTRDTAIAAVVETAVGLLNAGALAAVSRVSNLVFGEAELRVDLGMDAAVEDHELASLRGHLVVLSAAFGKLAPIGPPPDAGAAVDAVRQSSGALRRSGYGGRLVTDPAHIAVVNEAFTVDAAHVEAAEQLVDGFEKAVANGERLVDDHGRAVSDSAVNAAYRTLGRRPR